MIDGSYIRQIYNAYGRVVPIGAALLFICRARLAAALNPALYRTISVHPFARYVFFDSSDLFGLSLTDSAWRCFYQTLHLTTA